MQNEIEIKDRLQLYMSERNTLLDSADETENSARQDELYLQAYTLGLRIDELRWVLNGADRP